VQLGMEQISGSFDLTVSERWPGQTDSRGIAMADECRLFIGDIPVITGYVDDVSPTYSSNSHTLNISGRDKTGDLVDCSAIHKSGEWHNATLEKIAKDVCAPFGIKVVVATKVGKPFARFAIYHAESCFECLERAARMRGCLLMSDGAGNLVITRAASNRIATPLVLGQNVESGTGRFSMRDRHSQYIVKGQVESDPWDTGSTKHTAQKASVADSQVPRYRPLIVIAEQGDGSTYKDRAIWERNVRFGRAERATYTVTGWTHPGGLWLPNRMVPVKDSYLGINEELLITNVTMTLDESGSKTEIELCRKEAFALINLPDKHKKKKEEDLHW
jgi:prophage tail gpP-like protein